MFEKFCEICNPDFKYFARTSAIYNACKAEFEENLSKGNVDTYIHFLESERKRVSESGSQAYKRKIECLILELKRTAWDNQTCALSLTNKERMLLDSMCKATFNIVEEKHEKASMEFLTRNYEELKKIRRKLR